MMTVLVFIFVAKCTRTLLDISLPTAEKLLLTLMSAPCLDNEGCKGQAAQQLHYLFVVIVLNWTC